MDKASWITLSVGTMLGILSLVPWLLEKRGVSVPPQVVLIAGVVALAAFLIAAFFPLSLGAATLAPYLIGGLARGHERIIVAVFLALCGGSAITGWTMAPDKRAYRALWDAHPQERVYRQTFTNTTVEVDGKSFEHCRFVNVRLMFRGLRPFMIVESIFDGSVQLATSNKAIANFMTAQDKLRAYGRATGIRIFSGEEDEKGNFHPISEEPVPQK